jgi:hypothetical protein
MLCCYLLGFFNAFILWNNEAVVHLCDLWHAGFHVLRGPRPRDAGHLCFGYCFDSKVGPYRPLTSYHSQSNLKSQQTLATAKILTHFIISIAVLENVPRRRVTEKSHLFHTKRRSGRDRECMASSVSRRSAIHYASLFIGIREWLLAIVEFWR